MSPLTVEVIRDEAAWQALEPEWRELFAVSPQAAPPLTFDWLWVWWEVFGAVYGGPGELRLFTVRRDGGLVGVLPLYRRRMGGARVLGFLSTGEEECEEIYPEYMNLLAAPGEEEACLEALAPVVFGSALDWDALTLLLVCGEAPLLPWVQRSLAGKVGRLRLVEQPCCQADLSGGMERYLERLEPKLRRRARRYWRALEAEGVTFEVAKGVDESLAWFEQLVAMNVARWADRGEASLFTMPRALEFHRRLIARLVPQGLALLSRTVDAGHTVSVMYGFLLGDKYDCYQSGLAPAEGAHLKSPGTSTHLALMAELCARGATCYDFLAGADDYKSWLATDQRRLTALSVVRPTLGGFTLAASHGLARVRRRLASLRG